jgi:hypothetical protein
MSDPTNSNRPDSLRDPHIDALWRAAASEEPPASIDDALIALARRESEARPRDVKVPAATRPQRWWWPLAAAAVIGAVVIGLLPLYPTQTLDRDMPVDTTPQRVPTPTKPQSSAASVDQAAQATEPVELQSRDATVAKQEAPAAKERVAANAMPRPMQSADNSLRQRSTTKQDGARRQAPIEARAKLKDADVAAEQEQRSATATMSSQPMAPMAPPSERDNAATIDMQKSAPALAAAPAALSGGSTSMPSAVAPPSVAEGKLLDRAAVDAAKRIDAAPSARMEAATPPPAARALTPWPAASSAAPRPNDSGASAPAVSPAVAEWIARLRKLRDEGKLEQARKEWTEFRVAHPEALQQLPPDLREWLIGKPQP